jgi:hypothetical protein
LDRSRALEVLGLDGDVDIDALKRRFRALARDHHPDRGGAPQDFHDLQAAYEVLRVSLAGDPRPPVPRVARGRPSRGEDAARRARLLDEAALDDAAEDLAARVTSSGACRYLSRAPGARFNRLAASLAVGTTSTLGVSLTSRSAADAPRTVHIELTGRSRAARRALSALDLTSVDGAAWSRRRGDAITVVEADVTGPDAGTAARRAAAATVRLLDRLGWPLRAWRSD